MSDTNNSGSPDRPDSDYEIDDCPVLPGDVDVEAIQRVVRSEAPVEDPIGRIEEACLADEATKANQDDGTELPIFLDAYDAAADQSWGPSIRVEVLVEGTCARCGYDRLVEASNVGSTNPAWYNCHACGALQFKTEPNTDLESDGTHLPSNPGQRLNGSTPSEVFDGDHSYRWDPTRSGRHTYTRDRPGLYSSVEEPPR